MMADRITLEEKKAYYDSVKASNYQSSLRLEGFSVEKPETTQPETTEKEEETDD